MQKRCPWCGKKLVTQGLSVFMTPSKKTPAALHFLHCDSCGNYCGQTPYTLRFMLRVLCVFLPLLLPFLLGQAATAPAIILIFPIVLWATSVPLVRMTAKEEVVAEPTEPYYMAVADRRMRKERIYLTDPALDEAPAFSVSSPIRVWSCDRQNRIKFTFLYDSPENETLLSRPSFCVYEDEGGQITLVRHETPEDHAQKR